MATPRWQIVTSSAADLVSATIAAFVLPTKLREPTLVTAELQATQLAASRKLTF